MSVRSSVDQQKLPSDINQTLGMVNLYFIDKFSKGRALSSEFFGRVFSIHTGFFHEVDPLAERISSNMINNSYNRAKRSIFDKKPRKIVSKKITKEEMDKTLGKITPKLIVVLSNTIAISGVLIKRILSTRVGFIKEAEKKASKFSYETKMSLYKSAKSSSTKQIKRSASITPKIAILDDKKNSAIIRDSDSSVNIRENSTNPRRESTNIREVATKNRSYKRVAITIAILGLAIFLAYYIFPMFQIEMAKVNAALDMDFVKKRAFYIWNNTFECVDYVKTFKNGKCVRNYIPSKKLAIDCYNLTYCECRKKCLSL